MGRHIVGSGIVWSVMSRTLTRIVSMHEGFCGSCDEVVSAQPRATQREAWADIEAHESIVHEPGDPS